MKATRELVTILTDNPGGTLQLAVLVIVGATIYRSAWVGVAAWMDRLADAEERKHWAWLSGVTFRRDFTFGRSQHVNDIRAMMRRARRRNERQARR